MGAKGKAALAPMDVPASYVEVAARHAGRTTPQRRGAIPQAWEVAIRTRSTVEPDFGHAVKRHRLIDAIAAGG